MKKLNIIEYRESLNNLYNKMGFDHFEQYCSCPPFSPTKCSCKSNREHLIGLFKTLLGQQAELTYQQTIEEALQIVKSTIGEDNPTYQNINNLLINNEDKSNNN